MRCIFVLALSFFSLSAFADNQAIYVVNMQRVIDESIIGKAARNNIEADVKKEELKLSKLKDDLDKSRAEADKQASLLSKEALAGKQEALEKKQRELMRAVQDKREELTRRNGAEIERVVKEIDLVIKELAEKNDYKFVVEKDKQYVLFVDEQFDLTDKVVEAVNKKKLDL